MCADLTLTTSIGRVPLTFSERGHGRPVLLLHGGAGPASVEGFADLLANATGARVLTPIHPGFGGTPRPESLTTVAGLAELYVALLEALGLDDVTVIGNSIGGWIAAEAALHHSSRLARLALVDAVGIEVPEHPVVDFFALTPAQIAEHSYHDVTKAVIPDLATLPGPAREIALGNREALALYGGSMTDPGLLPRLSAIDVPTWILWGAADGIVDPDYGRAYAAAIPGARFRPARRHRTRATDRDARPAAGGGPDIPRLGQVRDAIPSVAVRVVIHRPSAGEGGNAYCPRHGQRQRRLPTGPRPAVAPFGKARAGADRPGPVQPTDNRPYDPPRRTSDQRHRPGVGLRATRLPERTDRCGADARWQTHQPGQPPTLAARKAGLPAIPVRVWRADDPVPMSRSRGFRTQARCHRP